ncbi:MAG: 2-oxo-4-hydroxy-4-carboxy-5-ureidoimidazoline decarboxylase [Pseudomonadota bacterium]
MTDSRGPIAAQSAFKSAFRPSALTFSDFMAALGGVYEHSPWVAEALWPDAPSKAFDTPGALAKAMRAAVNAAPKDQRLELIRAHPELAGKAAIAGEMADASKREQAGAGLDQCSPEEYQAFQDLNGAYNEKFGFPFIIAVKGLGRAEILDAFRARLDNAPEAEFDEAIAQIHRIAGFRIEALFAPSPA